MGGGSLEVDVVITGTGAHHNLQLFGGVEYLGVYLVGTDDECVGILDGIEQLCFLRILLQQGQFVSCSLNLGLYTLHRCCGEGLFCCNKYFHC